MRYRIMWDPKALEFLRKLPENIADRIVKRVSLLQDKPFRFLDSFGDTFKLRIGDYRALVDIDEKSKIILIRVLGHRRNIYKKK